MKAKLSFLVFAIPSVLMCSLCFAQQEKVAEKMLLVERNLVSNQNLYERMKYYGVPGVSITVISNNKLEWTRGYGVTEARSNKAVTTETMFQAASISKPIAATVALYFVQNGRLNLDTDVNEQLKSWKVLENEYTKEQKVTLRRILSHTAGLSGLDLRGYCESAQKPTLIEILDGKKPAHSDPVRVFTVPGSKHQYSSAGYVVLQLLLEELTGEKFQDLAKKLVLDPLGMGNSTFYKPLPEEFKPKLSSGHLGDGTIIKGDWFGITGSACCGLWSTPSDLAKWLIDIKLSLSGESNKILSVETVREMLTKQKIGGNQTVDAGLGVELFGDGSTFEHGGYNRGFRCYMFASKETGNGAVIMTNSSNGGDLVKEIYDNIIRIYGW